MNLLLIVRTGEREYVWAVGESRCRSVATLPAHKRSQCPPPRQRSVFRRPEGISPFRSVFGHIRGIYDGFSLGVELVKQTTL